MSSQKDFNSVVFEFSDFLKPFAINLTKDYEDAKDLVQETMFKAIKNQDKYEEGTNLKAWLYTIMKNIFINNYRRKVKSKTFIDTTENMYYINSSEAVEDNPAEHTLVVSDLLKEINKLNEDYKVPFMMHYKGYKYHEIADKLRIPIGTVKSRIFLARKALKDRLHQYR